MLIPRYRDKLPHWLSYPLGAERISAALDGVQLAGKLELSFHMLQGFHSPADFTRSFVLLRISYRNVPLGISGSLRSGWNEETWSLTVYAVPSASRPFARLRAEEALVIARKWLRVERSEVWRYWKHELTLSLRLPDGELAVEEE
jgi:hypothetical protein